MTEVNDFLSRNPDIGSQFRNFAAQHETLRDVWKNCPAWYWMLDLLDRCHYRNAEKLERYIDRQSEHIEDVSDVAIEATRLRHFIWARIVAHEASDFIYWDKIDRVRFNNACAPIIDAEVGIESALTDETEVGRNVLRQQADELRELLGNPFQFAGANDFSYGGIG